MIFCDFILNLYYISDLWTAPSEAREHAKSNGMVRNPCEVSRAVNMVSTPRHRCQHFTNLSTNTVITPDKVSTHTHRARAVKNSEIAMITNVERSWLQFGEYHLVSIFGLMAAGRGAFKLIPHSPSTGEDAGLNSGYSSASAVVDTKREGRGIISTILRTGNGQDWTLIDTSGFWLQSPH